VCAFSKHNLPRGSHIHVKKSRRRVGDWVPKAMGHKSQQRGGDTAQGSDEPRLEGRIDVLLSNWLGGGARVPRRFFTKPAGACTSRPSGMATVNRTACSQGELCQDRLTLAQQSGELRVRLLWPATARENGERLVHPRLSNPALRVRGSGWLNVQSTPQRSSVRRLSCACIRRAALKRCLRGRLQGHEINVCRYVTERRRLRPE
jgi:hypothetical protein